MSGLKTRFLSLFLAAVLPTEVAASENLFGIFASCTGRLSAQLEHEWLMQDASAHQTERQRDSMSDILQALSGANGARGGLSLRVEAKAAHADLLRRATFNRDTEDARWAGRKARRDVAWCLALITGDPETLSHRSGIQPRTTNLPKTASTRPAPLQGR